MENIDYELNRIIREGDLTALQVAFQMNPRLCDFRPYGQSLPLLAVLERKLDVLEFLIAQDCDLQDGDDERGMTPLHAAALGQNLPAVKLLLEAGVPVDIQEKRGSTPLFRAVRDYQGDPAVIKLLLEHGADPWLANQNGVSPMQMAQKLQAQEIVDLFSKF